MSGVFEQHLVALELRRDVELSETKLVKEQRA